jgi:hypothetical protein
MKKQDQDILRRADEQAKRWSDAEPRGSAVDKMYYTQMQNQRGLPLENTSRVTLNKQARNDTALSHLSLERQEYLKEVNNRTEESPRPNLSVSSGLNKTASVGGQASGGRMGGTSNSTHVGPEPFSPLFLTQNMQLPRDRLTTNAWNRAYYETNPIVRNAINLHATYPISKLTIRCDDKRVERFFLDMCDRIDLETVVQQAALEFWKLGEKLDGDTLITMGDGARIKISEINVGDMVFTHAGNVKRVTHVFAKPTSAVVETELKILKISAAGLKNPLIISGRHPILSKNRGFHICPNGSCSAKGMRVSLSSNKCSKCSTVGIHNVNSPDFIESAELKIGDTVYSSPAAVNLPASQFTVNSIEDITSEYVSHVMYDIEVEDDHSYVANGISVHNCFVYASFDEATGSWDQLYLHNPDYIQVRASPVSPKNTTILLRPDPELKKIVEGAEPEYARIREQIDPKIINHVIRNEMIPLDNFNISHLKMLNSPYDVRGTSVIVSVWKDLMLYDKYRECKYIQADSMVNPITLVKVGTDGAEGFYPRQEELDAWRSIMEQAQFDRDFKIITHGAVSIERVGSSGTILDTAADINQIFENLFTGLMVPRSLLTQEGASYATASVALDVMRQRYNGFRTMIANWLERKIFAPIAEVQGFYDIVGQEKRLIVPKVEWNHMTLYDLDNYIAHLSTLVEKNKVSIRTLDRSLGLSRKNEIANIRQEMIEQSIMAKEQENLSKMTLSQLKSLNPNEPIPEPADSTSGGMPGGGLPGVPPPGVPGMPDFGGGMPPMPDFGGLGGGMPSSVGAPPPVSTEPPGGVPGAPVPPPM